MRVGGGWKIFQKLTSGGDNYSVLESTAEEVESQGNRII